MHNKDRVKVSKKEKRGEQVVLKLVLLKPKKACRMDQVSVVKLKQTKITL